MNRRKFLALIPAGIALWAGESHGETDADSVFSVKRELLVAKKLEKGYSWTIASRLGDALRTAEELFGPRDNNYTLLGVEFVEDHPRMRYSGDRKSIVIQLSLKAASNAAAAGYQLAHEVVHLLAPNSSGPASNFEEGVASWFSSYYVRKRFKLDMQPSLPSYKRVQGMVTPRLDEDADCIRRLRSRQPSFDKQTREDIAGEFPNLELPDINFLLGRFDRAGEMEQKNASFPVERKK